MPTRPPEAILTAEDCTILKFGFPAPLELDPFVDPVADTMVLLQPTYEASPSNVAVGAFGWLANVTMTSIGIVAEFEPTQKPYPESLVLAARASATVPRSGDRKLVRAPYKPRPMRPVEFASASAAVGVACAEISKPGTPGRVRVCPAGTAAAMRMPAQDPNPYFGSRVGGEATVTYGASHP